MSIFEPAVKGFPGGTVEIFNDGGIGGATNGNFSGWGTSSRSFVLPEYIAKATWKAIFIYNNLDQSINFELTIGATDLTETDKRIFLETVTSTSKKIYLPFDGGTGKSTDLVVVEALRVPVWTRSTIYATPASSPGSGAFLAEIVWRA